MAFQTRILPGTFQSDWLSNCAAWYRSDLGITSTTPGFVTSWADQTTNGHTLAPGVNAPQYTTLDSSYNSKPTLDFIAAAKQTLTPASFSLAQPSTTVVIGQVNVPGGAFAGSASGLGGTILPGIEISAGTGLVDTSTVSSPCVYVAIFNGTSSAIYNGGTLIASGNAGTTAMSGLLLGAYAGTYGYMTGKIAEVAFFSRALNANEIAELHNYAMAVYGTA